MTVKMKRNSQHFSGDESDTRLSKKIKSKKNIIPSSDEDSEQEDTVDIIEETEFHEMEEPVARHKGKKREIESDDEEEEEEDSEEEEYIAVTSSRAKAKRRINKLEYNDGTIEKISLKNFMCHQNLVMDFGENLNFIIGQNGSGKSAILTAIIIALGGKANFTNRGSSIKTFLKSGSSDGSIKIQICNKGSDPFKYEEYGDSVIVERRITANSGNTLRMSTIKDGKETTVSTKREELELMKDHMQISMDNPLTILTQDTSRSFLSNASSKELYKFFMRGTLLAQLEEDYKKLDDDISATASEIDRHTTVIIPEIKAEVSVLSTKWKALEHARNIDDRINALNRQLVWAEIQSKEEHVEGMKERCETAQQKVQEKLQQVEELNGEIDAKKLQIEKINIQVEKAEESFAPLQARENEMKKELKEHQLLLGTLKNHKDNINEDVKRLKLQVSTHQKNIDAEAAKLAKNSKSVREQKIKDIDNDKKRLAETKNDISDLQNQQLINEQKLEEISNEVKILEDDKHQKSMEIQTRKTSIEKLTREKNDKLISYGQEMRDVLRAIDDYDRQGKWRGRKPIGPFGQYIELKQDCKEYGKVIESHLNNTLNGLGVDNHEDMKLLQNVLRQYRCRSSVSKYSTKNIDYSRSQPDQSFLTILRCINVQDQYVLNHLIISEKIEKTILVATQREGDDLTYNGYPNQCAAVLTKNCENVGSSHGGLSVRNIMVYNGPPRLSADVKEYIEDEKIKLRSLSEDARNSEMALRAKLEEKNSLRNQIYMMKNQINQLEKTAGALERGINHKQASIQEDDPTTIAHYEEEKKRVEGSINVLHQQFADVHSQIVEQDEHIKHITDDIAKVRREKEGFATKLEEARQRKSQFEKDYHRLESKKSDVFRKYQQYQSYVEDKAKPAYEKACEDLEKQVEEASLQCARVKVTMPTDKLLKQIKKEEAMKIAATEEHGDVYDIHNQLKERKAALKFTIRSTNNIVKVNEALRESYTVRIKDFAHFKSSIIAQSKQLFGEKMAARGFRGKLKVNCAEEILELIVDVNESTAKKKGSKKLKAGDIKSLSGGEKSYSTICLLLALWDAMDVPFRALDEFDVFMDAVNRRLCMKLMMDNAREKDKKTQYIFITPQDMSHVNLQGTDVKIIRMMDPNRRATQN